MNSSAMKSMKSKNAVVFFMLLGGIALVGAAPVVMKISVLPEAKAAHEFCRSSTPNAEGEPLPDSKQTLCIDKKEGTYSFSCEGSYSEIGEECGQTFEGNKQELQKGIKSEREFCRESEDATCEKRKNSSEEESHTTDNSEEDESTESDVSSSKFDNNFESDDDGSRESDNLDIDDGSARGWVA